MFFIYKKVGLIFKQKYFKRALTCLQIKEKSFSKKFSPFKKFLTFAYDDKNWFEIFSSQFVSRTNQVISTTHFEIEEHWKGNCNHHQKSTLPMYKILSIVILLDQFRNSSDFWVSSRKAPIQKHFLQLISWTEVMASLSPSSKAFISVTK